MFTRHSAGCPKTDPRWKRCSGGESLDISEGCKDIYESAKTRSWERDNCSARG